jgi:hypothetical protein
MLERHGESPSRSTAARSERNGEAREHPPQVTGAAKSCASSFLRSPHQRATPERATVDSPDLGQRQAMKRRHICLSIGSDLDRHFGGRERHASRIEVAAFDARPLAVASDNKPRCKQNRQGHPFPEADIGVLYSGLRQGVVRNPNTRPHRNAKRSCDFRLESAAVERPGF